MVDGIGFIKLFFLTFVGPCPVGFQGCHDDGNPANNALSNLRWDTPQSNADDRIRHGTQLRGSGISRAVLTEEQVAEIKAALQSHRYGVSRRLARQYGVSDWVISKIKQGLAWRHVDE